LGTKWTNGAGFGTPLSSPPQPDANSAIKIKQSSFNSTERTANEPLARSESPGTALALSRNAGQAIT
jgi:hypothetical protein